MDFDDLDNLDNFDGLTDEEIINDKIHYFTDYLLGISDSIAELKIKYEEADNQTDTYLIKGYLYEDHFDAYIKLIKIYKLTNLSVKDHYFTLNSLEEKIKEVATILNNFEEIFTK